MKKQMLMLLASVCVVAGMISVSGCGAAATTDPSISGSHTVGAKADLELDVNQSSYPYLLMLNKGNGQAADVQVVEKQSGKELIPLGLVQKSGSALHVQPVTNPLNVGAGVGVQVQMNSPGIRAFMVKWKEGGKDFSKDLDLPEQQKIDTH